MISIKCIEQKKMFTKGFLLSPHSRKYFHLINKKIEATYFFK